MADDSLILVTGASGYLASHITKLLLEDGYKVRGTVRALSNAAKVDALKNLVPDAKHPIELVEADLTKDEGWDKAVEGCTGIIHVASPFPNVVKKITDDDVVGPARDGSLRVLKTAASQSSTVKHVVLTSSVAAVYASDPTNEAGKVHTEEDWSDPESPNIDSYSKSKILAEKAAWEFVKDLPDDQKFELVVINPAFIMGPALMEGHKESTSVEMMCYIMNKTYPAVPRICLPICDVRDVARAHIKALSVPEAASHRHIICSDSVWLKDMATTIAKEFRPQGYSIPTGQLPYFVCWIAGVFNRRVKTSILPWIGKDIKLDNKRMLEVLGVEPTATDTTLLDMAYSLVDLGIVRKAKKYKQVGSRAEVPAANGEPEENAKEEDSAELLKSEGKDKSADDTVNKNEALNDTKKPDEKIEEVKEKTEENKGEKKAENEGQK